MSAVYKFLLKCCTVLDNDTNNIMYQLELAWLNIDACPVASRFSWASC